VTEGAQAKGYQMQTPDVATLDADNQAAEPQSPPLDLSKRRALPIKDFCEVYGTNERAVWRALEKGTLKSIQLTPGGKRLILLEGVEQVIPPGTRERPKPPTRRRKSESAA
jgi:hypothetical protein